MQIRLGHTLILTAIFATLSLSSAFAFDANAIVRKKGGGPFYHVVKHENQQITVRAIDMEKLPAHVEFGPGAEVRALGPNDDYMGPPEEMPDTDLEQIALTRVEQTIEAHLLVDGVQGGQGPDRVQADEAGGANAQQEVEEVGFVPDARRAAQTFFPTDRDRLSLRISPP